MKLRPICSAIVLLAALSGAAHAEQVRRSYIVQLVDKPVATYTGQVAGLAATQPVAGQRLNVDAGNVQAYISYLDTKQNDVINSVSAAQITHKYDVVFNGFAALLTDDEVRALKKNAGVAAITADSELQLDTSYTPSFLGLDQPGGLWSQLGGQGLSGEDIIVGIVDSGVWPENPAYADRVDDQGNPSHSGSKQVYDAPPASWKGGCDTGEGFGVANCNNKLIGARFYKGATQQLHWTEFASARDSLGGSVGEGGHGSHTSTTVAGNASTNAIINGVSLGKITGMAPRARIAAYKVCWTDPTRRSSCATSNSVSAINQAVKDGVNVINFSIGPTAGGGAFDEATEQAFLGAAAAGVFVATSAGNSGPTAASPAPASHISPWLASVANSTHNRLYVGDAVLPTGAVLTGASSNANTPSSLLVLAKDAGIAGLTPAQQSQLSLCFGPADTVTPLLDPAKVTGKILVCDRGSNVLVNKSANAKTAGAVGTIIANIEGGAATILNQSHSLSTVHITKENGAILKSYIAGNFGAATASLGNLHTVVDPTVQAPVLNGSSSRGPNVADANILKPDLSAPGTDILAALTPDLTQAQRDAIAAGNPAQTVEFGFLTGTSMASPHVAGVAALLKQRHPTWSPAAIKSALMTSAYDTFADGQGGKVPWDTSATYAGNRSFGQGAGHISPNKAADPGLVYDISTVDYLRFLCGQGLLYTTAQCSSIGGGIAAYNLNLPSLTAATVLGSQTLTRTVTNVGESSATYTATADLPGFSVLVTPATLTLAPGAKATYTAKLTRTTAALDTWAYGSLTWSDGVHKVRSPLTARGTGLAVAANVYSEKVSGSKIVTVGTGFAGAFTTAKGLLPAAETTRSIAQANISLDNLALCRAGAAPGVNIHSFNVPAGTLLTRFSLFDSDNTGTAGVDSDLDLVLLRGTTLVGSSGNATSNESVQLVAPVAGTYTLCVIGYQPAGGQATYKLSSWVVQPTSTAGNFKVVSPSSATVGGTASVGLSWTNLEAGKRYVGAVNYLVGGVKQGSTVVDVDTTDPLPLFKNASNKGQFAY